MTPREFRTELNFLAARFLPRRETLGHAFEEGEIVFHLVPDGLGGLIVQHVGPEVIDHSERVGGRGDGRPGQRQNKVARDQLIFAPLVSHGFEGTDAFFGGQWRVHPDLSCVSSPGVDAESPEGSCAPSAAKRGSVR